MPTPTEIISMIDKRERNRSALQGRMDKDFDRYNLVAYQGEADENGDPILDGYKKFTANDPRTAMNLALHLLSTAPALIRVRKPQAKKQQREIDNSKELFALGVLAAANSRRADLMQPDVQDALSAQALFRGRTAQRVLLVKENADEDPRTKQLLEDVQGLQMDESDRTALTTALAVRQTKTFVDVQDWDPRNTYWAMGKHGLRWACHKMWKTAEQIEAEWGVRLNLEARDQDSEQEFAVYDWLDETHNQVVLERGIVLKKRTPHGMERDGKGRVPADIHMVGSLPNFQAEGRDYETNYGESFYQSDREMYDQQNFILSVLAELSKRSIAQGLLVFSADGKMSLESDPRVSGAETSLKSGQEDIKALPPMEMVKEAGALMGIIASMVQRGSFPASVFGELAFQLSGFAITQLRQGLEAPISPDVKAMRTALTGILNILADAYVSGNFDTMTFSGRMQDADRTDFEEDIPPEAVAQGGPIEVEIVPQLPQDDQSKAVLAQTLTAGPVPLVDHRFAREHIIQVQDVEQMERAVQEQLARTGSPAAVAFSNMLAAAEQGDMELAQIWFQEFQIQMMQRILEMTQLRQLGGQLGAGGGQGAGASGGGRGISSATLPGPLQGVPSPTPGAGTALQVGPIAPAGTQRPNRNGGTAAL